MSNNVVKKLKMKRRKRIRRRRKFILFCFTFIVINLLIGLVFKNDDTNIKTEYITNNQCQNNDECTYGNITDEIDSVDEIDIKEEKDNSGYLDLEIDENADDAAKILSETMYRWNFYREDNRKIAYLTFDDGPSSKSTNRILDILDRNNIKATFFVLGSSIESSNNAKETLKRIAKEGHSIGSHGYSHKYSILYPNNKIDVRAVVDDFSKNNDLLKDILGKDFYTRLIRLPGGYSSWNGTSELDKILEEKGIYQMDWNVLNGDAEGNNYTKEQLLKRLKETLGEQDVAIILMHDTDAKESTVEYLQSAIDYLKEKGFEFRTLK